MLMKLADLSNEALLSNLRSLIGQGRLLLARLLVYLGEVEERRLDAQSSCSSLFEFCMNELAMSEDEAWRRVTVARLAKRFPVVLDMLERGEIHLTAILMLREYLTEENHEALLHEAAGKTKSQVRELIAARYPRPNVSARIQELLRDAPPAASQKSGHVEPLSPERYEVRFTAPATCKKKLERTMDLMRHTNPRGDLAVIVERALDLLIHHLERRRLGRTKRPTRTMRRNTRRGYVTRAVRREVFARDGERCTFLDETGRRCSSGAFLELDHVIPRARGGVDDASNIRIRCRRHNGLTAERDFGREHIEKRKAERRRHPHQHGDHSSYRTRVALQALTNLGFKPEPARRALERIQERWAGLSPPPLEHILRETISILT
jgi:5-methylcytosine-specific restriction endonuclease McrA